MYRFLLRRLSQALTVLFLVSLITFSLIHSAPGGPELLTNPDLTDDEKAQITKNLGLDRPIAVQYAEWLGGVLQGRLGNSIMERKPVAELVGEMLPNTLVLTVAAMVISVLVAIPVGALSATRPHSWADFTATLLAFLGISVPVFWFALMMILLFSVSLGWLPSGGMATLGADFSIIDRIRHLIMPTLVLSFATMAGLARYARSAMLETLNMDYVRTARAKGLPERSVIYKHALRNALIPVITVVGLRLPGLVAGAVITETVFAWPGMGRLAVSATFRRDYPLIMGITMVISVVVVITNVLVDVAYGFIDPRIRYD